MAVAKLIAGWMAGAVLGVGIAMAPDAWRDEDRSMPSGRLFSLTAVGLVAVAILSSAPKIVDWLPGVSLVIVQGSLVLIGNGLLHLGLTNHPFRVIVGLLTLLCGFEILYAALEISALVAGLLATLHLGLALVGVFMLVVPFMETAD
jgi:hypothetical protein